ncbi:unnamed protein product [Sphacelaria rigidula]
MGSPEVWIGDTGWHVKNCAVRAFNKALMDRRFRMVNSPLSHRKCKRMMRDIAHMMSGQVLNEDGVVPSRAVAMRDCMIVPVPPLVSPKKASETGEIVDAQASAEAEYLLYWFGGKDMLFGGMLRFTMGVLEVAARSYRTRGIVAL